MTEHKPLTASDVGRVFVHGTEVRVVLLNPLGDEPFRVTVKCMEPTSDGEYIVTQVDSRHLAPTDERVFPNVTLTLRPEQMALLHSMVRESGWGYTEAIGPESVSPLLLEIADMIRLVRDASGTLGVKAPHAEKLFDAQFPGVSDSMMILGEER